MTKSTVRSSSGPGRTPNRTTSSATFADAIRQLCAAFPSEYWRSLEPDRYPTEFVEALTKHGWLAVLIPEEYGGGG